jgi:hypothetical protein
MHDLSKFSFFFIKKKTPPAGFEPATFRLTAECSNQLSYRGILYNIY